MRSVSRPGRSRPLRPSMVSPCSAAHSTSVRVSTFLPPATLATASRSSANPADNGTGVSSAPNRNRVVRVNIASYSAGFSVANLLYASATRRNSCSGPPAPRRAVAEGLGELAETLECDGLDDVLHRREVLVEHWLAVLDLRGQPAGGDRIPALELGKGAGR